MKIIFLTLLIYSADMTFKPYQPRVNRYDAIMDSLFDTTTKHSNSYEYVEPNKYELKYDTIFNKKIHGI